MLGLLFDPEEEGEMFLRNIGLVYKKLMLNHILIQLNPVLFQISFDVFPFSPRSPPLPLPLRFREQNLAFIYHSP
jgi:hypothetical protein